MEETITYVGLDVHEETISVAVAESGDRGQAPRTCRSRPSSLPMTDWTTSRTWRKRSPAPTSNSPRFTMSACSLRSRTSSTVQKGNGRQTVPGIG